MTANFQWELVPGLETSRLKPPTLLPDPHSAWDTEAVVRTHKAPLPVCFASSPAPTVSRWPSELFSEVTLALRHQTPSFLTQSRSLLSSPPLLNINFPLSIGSFPTVYRYVISPILNPLCPTTKQTSKNLLEKSCLYLLSPIPSLHAPSNPLQWHWKP